VTAVSFTMGNTQSGEDRKEHKSPRNSKPEQLGHKVSHSPDPYLTKEHRVPVIGNTSPAVPDGSIGEDGRIQQDRARAVRSNLLAPADSHTSKQDDYGNKGIDLESAISLLQHLKKTASPDDLIALRNYISFQIFHTSPNNCRTSSTPFPIRRSRFSATRQR
jgi:hypothetical protein